MKKIALFLSVALTFVLAACSGNSKEEAILADKCSELNMQFMHLAKGAPDFIESLACEYAAPNLLVNLKLDSDINPDEYSQALVEYVVANYIRSNAGQMMDAIVNGINRTKGSLSITVTNSNMEAKEFTIGHARLVQLVQKKNSELNFNDVKENVVRLLEMDCKEYMGPVDATSCTFAMANGFAQYTLTFKNAQAFGNQTTGTILGRYIPVMQKQYARYGAASSLVIDVLKSLQIDGYRFVYTDEKETKKISSALPWKLL